MSSSVRRLVAGVRDAYGPLWSGGRGWILSAIAFGWLLSLGVRLTVPALLPAVRAEFGMDLTTAGLLLTLLWLGYAVSQFPGGLVADRFGERNALVASSGLAAATVVAVTASSGFAWFFASVVLFGLASGLYATTRFTAIADVFPDRDATALGVTSAAGNVGTTVLPAAAGIVTAYAGWRAGFGMAVPFFVVTVVGLWLVVPERTSESGSGDRLSARDARRIARAIVRRPVLVGGTAMLLLSFVYQSFTGFYPTYLVSEKGLSQAAAATLFGLFFGVAIPVQPLAGAAGDRFGTRPTLLSLTAASGLALALLPFAEGLPALVGLTVLASLQLGFWPVAQGYVIGALPDDIQGSGFGLVRTAYLIVAATGPTVVGALADVGRFDAALLFLAGVAAAAIGLCAWLPGR